MATPTTKPQEFIQNILEIINNYRKEAALDTLVLGDNTSAQKHAEDQLKNNFFSQWGTDGMKPYMRYSLAGGYNYVVESMFYYRIKKDAGINPKEIINQIGNILTENPDARSGVLYKLHKKVNIGVAFNQEIFYLIWQYEGDYIKYDKLPTLNGTMLSMSGKVKPGAIIEFISLYFDPLPVPLSSEQLKKPPYDASVYDYGSWVGGIVPPPPPGSYYVQHRGDRVQAFNWVVSPDGTFLIDSDIKVLLNKEKGIYTLVMVVKFGNETFEISNYSLFLK